MKMEVKPKSEKFFSIVSWVFVVLGILFIGIPSLHGLMYVRYGWGGAAIAYPWIKLLTSVVPLLLLGWAVRNALRKRFKYVWLLVISALLALVWFVALSTYLGSLS